MRTARLLLVAIVTVQVWGGDDSLLKGVKQMPPGELLYRLASFVQWPEEERQRGEPFLVGLAGNDPLESTVSQWARETLPDGRALILRRVYRLADMRRCRVLFVGRSLTSQAPSLLTALRGVPVLTVGAIPGFSQMGGMVEIPLQEQHRRLQVNPLAARRAGLQLHPGLLTVVTVILPFGRSE